MKNLFLLCKRAVLGESVLGFASIAIAFIFVVLGGFGFFHFNEWQRAALLKKLEIPPEVLGRLNATTPGYVGDILVAGERLLCTLHPYVDKSALRKGLNSSQIASLETFELPSEDMIWYLLFFSDTELTRAFLVEKYSQMHLAAEMPQCVNGKDSYIVETKGTPSGESKELTFISSKK